MLNLRILISFSLHILYLQHGGVLWQWRE